MLRLLSPCFRVLLMFLRGPSSVSRILLPSLHALRAWSAGLLRPFRRRGFLKRRTRAPVLPGAFVLLFVCFAPLAHETADFAPVEMAELLEPSVGLGEKDVEIVLRKIRFDAEVAGNTKPRQTRYLTGLLRDMGANPVPAVSQGMDVRAATGQTFNVYLEDSVAERAGLELQTGDKARWYGYHIYRSLKHGPGILVSGFEKRSRFDEWKERLGRWYDGLRAGK